MYKTSNTAPMQRVPQTPPRVTATTRHIPHVASRGTLDDGLGLGLPELAEGLWRPRRLADRAGDLAAGGRHLRQADPAVPAPVVPAAPPAADPAKVPAARAAPAVAPLAELGAL
mgnify:CR=1 FL=1